MENKKIIPFPILFFLSFLEGGCVMTTELTGARVLAPVFGTSLYVWSAVLAITLCGLACGYFFGGRISSKKNPEKKLLYILIFAGIFMICVPVIGKFMNLFAFHFPLLTAVSLSALLVLFPPLFFMGMVSPLIIHSLINEKKGGGKRSGEVYAVSTVGGILFTFLTGFWLLPSFGNSTTLLAAGILLLLLPLFYLIKLKNSFHAIVLFAFAGFTAYTNFKNQIKKEYVLYESEGIFGKVEVVDFIYFDQKTKKQKHPRYLLVNNIIQTQIDVSDSTFVQDYPAVLDCTITENGSGKKTLLLGLGGGALANVFSKKKFGVTALELDERIYKAAQKYFFLNKNVNVIIDDARHYINEMNEKYDYILIDLYKGEDPPFYVLTKESIDKMKNSLTDSGKIIVSTYAYLLSEKGNGNRALLKTFHECGMKIFLERTGTKDNARNLLIYASKSEKSRMPEKKYLDGLYYDYLLLSDSPVLTDNNCLLDLLNAEGGMDWRQQYIRNFILGRK